MDFVQLVNALATKLGIDYKTLSDSLTSVGEKQGDLSTLTTAEKTNLVGALNELKSGLTQVSGEVLNASTIQTMIDNGIAGVVDGAPEALNTLNEIAQALADDDTALDGILAALAKRVRVDAPQAFSDAEKAQGRDNIGAQDAAKVGDIDNADFVATYETASA